MNFRGLVNTPRARERRYRKICQLVGLTAQHSVLDVGCGNGDSFEAFNGENQIVGLDIYPEQRIFQANFRYLQGDGADMGCFRDKEFDVVVCIGVLEHIFPFEKLERMAKEMQRVGKAYAVVIPHYFTPIEPHYQMPLWQFYPNAVKSLLARHFSMGSYRRNPSGQIRPLNYFTKARWLSLFDPGASVLSYNHISWLVRDFIVYARKQGWRD